MAPTRSSTGPHPLKKATTESQATTVTTVTTKAKNTQKGKNKRSRNAAQPTLPDDQEIRIESKKVLNGTPIMSLPNEIFYEVASNVDSIKDLYSLVRTSRFFHGIFNTQLYRRAVAADDTVRQGIVLRVLENRQRTVLTRLLDLGLSVNQTCRLHLYPYEEVMLRVLCLIPDVERTTAPLADLLVQRGAQVEARGGALSDTVLSCAVKGGNHEIVTLLLAHGADPNTVDTAGNTPLHLVDTITNGIQMINLLMTNGAQIGAINAAGSTPLRAACVGRRSGVVSELLAHGADASEQDTSGETLLHYAASRNIGSLYQEWPEALLEHGASINATDTLGRTPLHCAIEEWGRELFMTEFLVENGADVNAVSNDGRSPLQYALHKLMHKKRQDATIALLLEHGANTKVLAKNEKAKLARIVRKLGGKK